MLNYLRLCSPALKALLFSLIPLTYYLFDKLNYSQAGKAGVLGFLVLGTLFYWREVSPKKQGLLNKLLLASLFILTLNIGFQATLRDVFSVQQEDTIVIQAIFSTDSNEAQEFFIQYANYIAIHATLFLVSFISYWFCFIRPAQTPNKHRINIKRQLWLASLFTFFLVAIHFNPTARKANPLFYFPYNYVKWQGQIAQAAELQSRFSENAQDPQLDSMVLDSHVSKNTVVFVIGESDTRNNWSLYGYERDTNPQLRKYLPDLKLFNDVIAADGGTISSITKMLTPATMEEPDAWADKPSIVTIAKKLGYKVIWITNQGNEGHGVVSLMAAQSTETTFTNLGRSRGEGSVDEVVITPYQNALDDPADKKLIIVHILGAHPAYNYRYPNHYGKFEKTYDDPVAKQLAEQGRATWAIEFRNMYDSAIRYQDYVLSELLGRLINKNDPNSAWLYTSDHGEDVAHNTNFSGHNGKVKEMWEVPLLFWAGDNYQLNDDELNQVTQRAYQADVIDHTLLGLMGISGAYYDERNDLLSRQFDQEYNLPRNLRGLSYKD